MSEFISKAQLQWLMWRLAFAFFVFYTIDSICTAVVSVMIGSEWGQLSNTERFIRVALVLKAWATAMLALFTNASKRLQRDEFPIGSDVQTPNATTAQQRTEQ